MRKWIAVLTVLFNIFSVSAQIEWRDSTSTGWDNGPGVDINPGTPTGRVAWLRLSASRLLLSGGETAQLVATVNSDAADKTVAWCVADPAIATVSDQGLVSALTMGQTVVTATTADGGFTAQCLVTVKNNASIYVERIDLDKTELALYVGETYLLHTTVWPDNATDQGVTWEDRGITYYNPATIASNGLVTAVTPGVIELKCRPADGAEAEAVCRVTVSDPRVSSLTLPSAISLKTNEMRSLTPTVSPTLKQMRFRWSIADPTIASVTSSGRIIGIQQGTTTVTATALDGTGISATSTVTVSGSIADWGYSGWVLESGETIRPWTARCFHRPGYYGQTPPADSNGRPWYSGGYDDSDWEYAYGPLMNSVWGGAGERRTGYGQWEPMDWTSMSIRQQFYLPEISGYDFSLYVRVYSDGEVYLNGKKINANCGQNDNDCIVPLNRDQLVFGGMNTIAIIGYPEGMSQYLDFGLHYERSILTERIILPKTQTMARYTTLQLDPVIKPATVSRPGISWSSSDEQIAVVEADGTVFSLSPGTVTITATATDGSAVSAQCQLTVTEDMASMKPGDWILPTGEAGNWQARTLYARLHEEYYDHVPPADADGNGWTSRWFDDSQWTSTSGPIDRGNWPDDDSRYYVRRRFFCGDMSALRSVKLYIRHDDEAEVYINGIEVTYCEGAESSYVEIPLSKAYLRTGQNVICVNIHQGNGDAFIDFGLMGSSDNSPVPMGDANADGNIDTADVSALQSHILGLQSLPASSSTADLNRDGAITISDLTTLISFLLQIAP